MKTPPLLLGVTLLFWGWQTEFLLLAALMAAIIEGARFVPFRWDFTPGDFSRLADLGTLMLVGMVIYLVLSQSLLDIIFILLQWLPFAFFPILAGQCYSVQSQFDVRALLPTLRRTPPKPAAVPLAVNLTYPFVLLCLLAAGAANVKIQWFYWGLCVLSAWGLWALRAKRYSGVAWGGLLVVIGVLGYGGQLELARLQRSLEQNTTLLRWFTGFQGETDPYQSVTAIGDIGAVKLTNRVIFRVRSESGRQPPLLFRETSYDMYQSSKWYAARSEFAELQPEKDGLTWKRESPAIPGSADSLPAEPTPSPSQEGNVNAKPTPNPSQEGSVNRVTVSLALPNGKGILKLPTGTFQIDKLPAGILASNQFGALKVTEGPELITYQALFRPHGMVDSPPQERDLFIPPDERAFIRNLANELRLTAVAPDETLAKIRAFFQEHFTYSLTLSRQVEQITPLADFLLNSRAGHCEYFATATVLLLRAAGIPARYAVGYAVTRLAPDGSWTLVRGRDAHAWTLVYLHGAWHDFDTTPPSWRQFEEQRASAFEFIDTLWSQWLFAFTEWREREGGGGKYLGWLLLPLLLTLAWKLYAKKRIKQVKKRAEPDIEIRSIPGSDSEFYLIEQHLQAAGFVREPWEPLTHWLQRLENHTAPGMQALPPILALHYRYRFDPAGISPAEKTRLQEQVHTWLAQVAPPPSPSQEG